MAMIMFLGFIVLFALPSIIWLYAVADVIRNEFQWTAIKFVWLIVLFVFPPFGTILYFVIGRNQRITFYPVGRLVLFCIFVVPALMVVAYLLYSFGHLTFMPDPPKTMQIQI